MYLALYSSSFHIIICSLRAERSCTIRMTIWEIGCFPDRRVHKQSNSDSQYGYGGREKYWDIEITNSTFCMSPFVRICSVIIRTISHDIYQNVNRWKQKIKDRPHCAVIISFQNSSQNSLKSYFILSKHRRNTLEAVIIDRQTGGMVMGRTLLYLGLENKGWAGIK